MKDDGTEDEGKQTMSEKKKATKTVRARGAKRRRRAPSDLDHALDQVLGSVQALNSAVLAAHTVEALAAMLEEAEQAPIRALSVAHVELRGGLIAVETCLRALGARAGV